MAWNEAVVTNSGLELLTRCVLGGSVEITSAVGGETVSPSVSLLAVKEIAEPNHVLHVAKIDRLENGVRVNVRAQNNGLSTGYRLRQIGLFAKTAGSDETPVLLALIQDKDGEEVPTEEENPEYLLEYDFVIPLSNAENISVSVTPNTFATLEDLEPMNMHIKDKGNPHGVTKAQVGLGNVPNVTTNDQTPTYTVSAALAELVSGEKLGTVMGKLAKAVKELIAHLADNVRHITASERASWNGKANGTHGHSEATQSAGGFMSAADKKKLDGIATGANSYSLPAATASVRGGVKIGYTANGKNYPVQLSNEQMYVNVPWTDNNTTYSAATQSANGLMSAADKKKLDGIATGANAYTHPSTAGNKHIPSGGKSGQILRWSADGTATWGADNNTTYSAATQSANGLMSAADKKKLDGMSAIKATSGTVTAKGTANSSGGYTPVTVTVTLPHAADLVLIHNSNASAIISSSYRSGSLSHSMYSGGATVVVRVELSNDKKTLTFTTGVSDEGGTFAYTAFSIE